MKKRADAEAPGWGATDIRCKGSAGGAKCMQEVREGQPGVYRFCWQYRRWSSCSARFSLRIRLLTKRGTPHRQLRRGRMPQPAAMVRRPGHAALRRTPLPLPRLHRAARPERLLPRPQVPIRRLPRRRHERAGPLLCATRNLPRRRRRWRAARRRHPAVSLRRVRVPLAVGASVLPLPRVRGARMHAAPHGRRVQLLLRAQVPRLLG